MKRIELSARSNLDALAEEAGFDFHVIDGERYWDETRAYSFTLRQIEDDIEDPTQEIHGMLLSAVGEIISKEGHMRRMGIPEMYWDAIAASFRAEDPMLYGRIDLSYNGQGPAKLLEANYDTPTSIFEAAYFQWNWLEDLKASGALPHGADQYNNLQDRMIEVFKGMGGHHETMHFSGISDIPEERSTVLYLQELAAQAGQKQKFVDIREVGIDLRENFVDPDGERIHRLFKLYPLEAMFEEEFGKLLCKRDTLVIEPLWKAVISNKAILPMLWEFFPGHKNLLPAYFEGDPNASRLGPSYVRKPIFSREGANVRIVKGGSVLEETDGEYDKAPCILQAFAPLPEFDGDYPVIGSWVVGQTACGMGIREDRSRITKNSSRFVPHFIDG